MSLKRKPPQWKNCGVCDSKLFYTGKPKVHCFTCTSNEKTERERKIQARTAALNKIYTLENLSEERVKYLQELSLS